MRTLTSLAALAALVAPPAGGTVPAYDVRGVAIHQCSCRYACPCMFENAPEKCALVAAYHLESGTVGGVSVAGLSFLSVDGTPPGGGALRTGGDCCRPANGAHDNARNGVIFLDSKATTAQRGALLTVLKDHGEWPGDGRPVEVVPITFVPTATGYRVSIPGVFHGEVVQVKSRKGTPLTVDGVGFPEGPHWVVGRSTVNDLNDPRAGVRWRLPHTNGSWTLLHWTHG